MQNFSSLVSKLREEFEVTNGQTPSHTHGYAENSTIGKLLHSFISLARGG